MTGLFDYVVPGDWVKVGTKIRCKEPFSIENPVTKKPFEIPVGMEAEISETRSKIRIGGIKYYAGYEGFIDQLLGDFIYFWEPAGPIAPARPRPQRSMIVSCHPSYATTYDSSKYRGKKLIGYWAGSHDPDSDEYAHKGHELPWPADFIDPSWDHEEQQRVVGYLANGTCLVGWKGYSWCRIGREKCRVSGAYDMTDGTYVWPEGFAHYVEVHKVKPPQEFIDHLTSE